MSLSVRTKVNWLLDGSVFLSALIAAFSGIYFLYLPIGGFQGGRNPTYGLRIFFERATWDDLHTWSGVMMIIVGLVHLIYHWSWVRMMAKRLFKWGLGQQVKMSRGAQLNVVINLLIGLGFLTSAISGAYLLFQPHGGIGINSTHPFIFMGSTWDVIHTWSSIIMIMAAMTHFLIHWGWIEKVTMQFFYTGYKRVENPLSSVTS